MSFLKLDHHDLRGLFPRWFPRIPLCTSQGQPIPCGDRQCCRVFVHGLRWEHIQKAPGSPPSGLASTPQRSLCTSRFTRPSFPLRSQRQSRLAEACLLAATLLTSYLWLRAARSSLPCYSVLNRTEEPLALTRGFYLLNPQVGRLPSRRDPHGLGRSLTPS